jgi:hypothetical protein
VTLPDYIYANRSKPFVWGSFDCVLFVRGWALEYAGRDLLDGIDSWSTKLQATRIIKKLGGLEHAFDERCEAINPHLAVDGDIGMWDGCCGIFSGRHLICAGPNQLEYIDRTQCSIAWRC